MIPIYGNNSSRMMTIPIRIAKKYKLYHSDIIYEERGDGGLFIKKGKSPAMTRTFMTGKRTKCGLIIPAYLARKYELSNRDSHGRFLRRPYRRRRWYFYKKINTLIHYEFLFNNLT